MKDKEFQKLLKGLEGMNSRFTIQYEQGHAGQKKPKYFAYLEREKEKAAKDKDTKK